MAVDELALTLTNNETIRHLAAEDSFYENAGFLWLLLTASAFFYLYFKKTSLAQQKKHNIFFLLLGILFFFAAGEEVSWGQRIFHIATPQILNSNVQHELNIHNLPIFKWSTTDSGFLDWILDVNTQFINFFLIYAYFTPLLYESIKSVRTFLDRIYLPIPPAWLSIFFLINYYLSQNIALKVNNSMVWPVIEIKETAFCFLFFVISLWMIATAHIKKKTTHSIDRKYH